MVKGTFGKTSWDLNNSKCYLKSVSILWFLYFKFFHAKENKNNWLISATELPDIFYAKCHMIIHRGLRQMKNKLSFLFMIKLYNYTYIVWFSVWFLNSYFRAYRDWQDAKNLYFFDVKLYFRSNIERYFPSANK